MHTRVAVRRRRQRGHWNKFNGLSIIEFTSDIDLSKNDNYYCKPVIDLPGIYDLRGFSKDKVFL